MAVFELQGPDGKTYEVEAADPRAAIAALGKMVGSATPQPNPDGTYGSPPEGMVLNPQTGQMEDLRSPINPNIPTGRGNAAMIGGGQGLSYDMLDEAVGGISQAVGGNGEYAREVMREGDRRAQEDYPFSYGAPKVAGAVATSLGLGKMLGLTAAPTATGRAAQGVALGGAEGAAFGFGQGEGFEDRAKGAVAYGSLGAALGGATPFALEGGRRAFDAAIGGPVAAMRSAPNEVRASRAVQSAIQRSGQSADDVQSALTQAAREGQPEFVMADAIGNPGQRTLSSITRSPTDARAEIVEYLTSRQDTQGERLSRIVSEAMQAPDTAAARTAALTKARKDAADVAYEAARQNARPVNLNEAIDTIDELLKRDPILGETALSQGPVGQRLSALRSRLAAGGEQLIDFDTVLNIKSDLYEQMQRGRGGREMSRVYEALDGALEGASDGYRAANDQFRAASRVIDQIDAGLAAASPQVRSEDVIPQYQGLTPEQQEAFRVGRAEPVLAKIGAAPATSNAARPLTSGKSRAELGAMAADPELLDRQLRREGTMFETARKALGGSETAERLADDAEQRIFDYGPVVNALRGNWGAAASQAGVGLMNVAQGRNSATREQIARALLSKDVQAALAPALRADMMRAGKSNVVEALVRALPRLTGG